MIDRNAIRLAVLYQMLKLEIKGLTSRGRSAYSQLKEQYGFKGSRLKVLEQTEQLINKQKEALNDKLETVGN